MLAGSLRALAITAEMRLDTLPGVPPLAEFLPGYEASNWAGIGAPVNTPAEIIAKLNAEINAGLADRKLKAQLADMGATVLAGSPADFGRFIAAEIEKWAKVVRCAGIRAE
jgi:tripartite-type tricarboxylate transporter receptor subunit TctC